jgi:aromatic-L-amino-acid decarboxylase
MDIDAIDSALSPRTGGPAMDVEEFRRLGYKSIDMIASYLGTVHEWPVFRPMTPSERGLLTGQQLTSTGIAPETLIDTFADNMLPFAMGNGNRRFFGWVNSPPAPIGILAELLAAGQDPACDVGDLAALHLETSVVRWLAELVGFPTDTMGILVSGGSVATLTCLTVARQWVAEADGWDVRVDGLSGARAPLTVYMSTEAHSSVRKSIELLGLGSSAIRLVPVDEQRKLDPAALRDMVKVDRSNGARPFLVVGSAGTVNTGAVDPFDAIADVCDEHGLWLHVDGAYGAVGRVHPEFGRVYQGLERANSLSLDPHKWLSVPIECGCALVRDRELMRRTFSLVPPYLRTEEGLGVGGPPSYAEYGIQQTRGFRALKLWMTLQYMGRDGVRDLIVHSVELARYLASVVERADDLELMAGVELSIVCFRYVPGGPRPSDEALDALNREIEHLLQSDGRTFLTSTVLDGRFVLRACVLHYGSTERDVDALINVVREIGERTWSSRH